MLTPAHPSVEVHSVHCPARPGSAGAQEAYSPRPTHPCQVGAVVPLHAPARPQHACLLCRENDKPHNERVLQGCPVDRMLAVMTGLMLLAMMTGLGLLAMMTGLMLLAMQPQMERHQRSGMSGGQCTAWSIVRMLSAGQV